MARGAALSWSAQQYVVFEDERTRPVRDLLGALPAIRARSVIDLGCGPGNSTEMLAARFPEAEVSAIDSSPDMIAAAKQRLPKVNFRIEDVQDWAEAGHFEVILANAVLQWVPCHERLMPRLVDRLSAGGALAVQMPDNLDEPAHRLMRRLAMEGPWTAKMSEALRARPRLAAADWYYEALKRCCSRVDLWRTTYYHALAGGAPAIAEWFKGSGLRPFLDPLDGEERADYLQRFTLAIGEAYPSRTDGSVLLPFPRLFLVAVR